MPTSGDVVTDSIDKRGQHRPLPAEVKARLALQRDTRREVTDFADLPTYVRTACAMHELMGMTWEEVGERLGKKPETIKKYTQYTAYRTWRDELQTVSKDPKAMAELALRANAMGITLDYLAAFQTAVDAGAYTEVAKMAKDLLDRAGVIAKKSEGNSAINIRLSLGGALLEGPVVEAEWSEADAVTEDE